MREMFVQMKGSGMTELPSRCSRPCTGDEIAEVEHEIDRGRDVLRNAPSCRRRVGVRRVVDHGKGALGRGGRDVFHIDSSAPLPGGATHLT